MNSFKFPTIKDAIAVSQQLSQPHQQMDEFLFFDVDRVDIQALRTVSSLVNTTYEQQGHLCLLPIDREEWNSRECLNSSASTVYVACLAAYNHGKLHGMWVDCDRDPADIYEDIDFMLSWSPTRHLEECEDWAIHDYNNFEGIELDEHESIEEVATLAHNISEYGDAFVAYYKLTQCNDADKFQDVYLGEWTSVADYVEELYENSYDFDGMPSDIRNNINWEAIADDWECNEVYAEDSGHRSVYIFSRRY